MLLHAVRTRGTHRRHAETFLHLSLERLSTSEVIPILLKHSKIKEMSQIREDNFKRIRLIHHGGRHRAFQ